MSRGRCAAGRWYRPVADLCLALHRTLATSKGTKDCVRQALAAGIPVYLIEDDRAIPTRLQEEDARLA